MLVYFQELFKTFSFRRKLVLAISCLVQVPLISATIALNAHCANRKIRGLPVDNNVEIALYVMASVSGVIALLTLAHELWSCYRGTLNSGRTETPDENIDYQTTTDQDPCVPLPPVLIDEDPSIWTEYREVTSIPSIDMTELVLQMDSLYMET